MTSAPHHATPGVVFHLDEGDPAKHESVLRNVANVLDALGDGTVVELVTHGPGLRAVLAGAPHETALRTLIERGVQVDACANTMRREHVGEDQLAAGVTIVPAGIVQLIHRQRDGWSYVRP
ncbi:DsrE family protein [Microlunatus antarcticus]|uniref:DsrE/DsrF-like family protein n=1 Tax=Microlunatus antarcticus TaxID=53388 RepID=A0A7W5JVC7_9ACTN|nr:hypothetical protein [Microlunatus antarcticus]